VKTGSGAFMPTLDRSRELARSLVDVANGAGTKTAALITDMNEPLASAAATPLKSVTPSISSPARIGTRGCST